VGLQKTTDTERYHYFDCTCGDASHTLRFTFEEGDESWPPSLYTEVQLSDYPGFWRRLWRGVRYVFGHKSRYGYWDCTLIQEHEIPRLQALLSQYQEALDKYKIATANRRI
jgi:valyl-tRNA synthetase